jgi:hypothetical protein
MHNNEEHYVIPSAYRRMENLHIVFWLFKDLAWCMEWRLLGVVMIIPTLFIAGRIAWNTRYIAAEFCHNAAIFFWIIANSYWMCSEFFHFDKLMLLNGIPNKYLAVIPFTFGIIVLGYYYGYLRLKYYLHKKESKEGKVVKVA